MDALDAAWEELSGEVAAGDLAGVDRRSSALERLGQAAPARLRERVRQTLERFWDLVQVDPTRALGQAGLAEAVSERLCAPDPRLRAELALRRATALFALGRARQAVAAARAALDGLGRPAAPAASGDGDEVRAAAQLRAGLLGVLAHALLAQGRVGETLIAVEEALALARAHGLDAALGTYLSTLGTARLLAGDLRAAEEYYAEALRIARRHQNREGEVVNLGNLGLIRHILGEAPAALADYREALALARRLGDRRAASSLEANIGLALAEQGDLEGATNHYDVALELARVLADRALEALARVRLAGVARERGAFDEARRMAAEAESLLEAIGDPRLSAAWLEAGRVALDAGEPAAARASFERALARADAVGDRRSAAAARYELGRAALAAGEAAAALGQLEPALAAARELSDPLLEAAAAAGRAEALLALGRAPEATAALASARAALPSAARAGQVAGRLRMAEARLTAAADPLAAKAALGEALREARERAHGALAAELERRLAALAAQGQEALG